MSAAAAAVLRGRAVPLAWASYTDGQLTRSQNSFEEGLPRLLVAMLPAAAGCGTGSTSRPNG